MLPAGPRGGASTTTVQSCARETRATGSAAAESGARIATTPWCAHGPRATGSAAAESGATMTTTQWCAHATRAAVSAPSRRGRRDTRHVASHVQARTSRVARRATPVGPAGRFARSSHQARRYATLGQPDVGRGLVPRLRCHRAGSPHGSVARRSMPCTRRAMPCMESPSRRRARSTQARSRGACDAMHGVAVTSPSTVGEHRDVVIQDRVPANAPGRSEGRCEHHDRAVVRSRDTRHGVCGGRERRDDHDHAVMRSRDTGSGVCTVAPWQTRHSPRRRREPAASRVVPLPSDLPDASRDPRTKPAGNATLDQPDVGRGLVPRLRRRRARSTKARSRGARCHARSRRHVAEHGRRASRRRDPRSRSRECSRQDRGEVQAPRPCSRALARHGPRRLLRQRAARQITTMPWCAHGTRATGSAAAESGATITTRPWCANGTRSAASAPSRRGRRETRHFVRYVAGANQRRRASCHSRRTCRALRAILAPSPRVTRLSTNQM
jgi:hypothetical protein